MAIFEGGRGDQDKEVGVDTLRLFGSQDIWPLKQMLCRD